MSGVRFKIIYGVPWPQHPVLELARIDPSELSFERLYTANGPSAGFCGVELQDMGCENFVLGQQWLDRTVPTDQQKQKAQENLVVAEHSLDEIELPETTIKLLEEWEVKNLTDLIKLDNPQVWFIWYNT